MTHFKACRHLVIYVRTQFIELLNLLLLLFSLHVQIDEINNDYWYEILLK